MDLVSYKEAVAKGLPKYFTGKPCKRGHIAERRVSGRCCSVCANDAALMWAKNNPEKSKFILTQWNQKNKAREAARARVWRKNNPDKYKRSIQEWRQKNAAEYKAYMNYVAIKQIKERAKRTPSWLNKGHEFEIRCIYKYCAALRSIGLDYHVDHIVPLQNKNVSGLNVPWNMQVIPAKDNLSKGAKFNFEEAQPWR